MKKIPSMPVNFLIRFSLGLMASIAWVNCEQVEAQDCAVNIKTNGKLAAIAISPTGSHLAIASTPDSGAPTKLDLWDLSSSKGTQISLSHRSEPARTFLLFSPDQKSLVICTDDNIQSIDRATGKVGAKLPNETLLRAVNGWMLTLYKKGSLRWRRFHGHC